jgi:hypothetical protein
MRVLGEDDLHEYVHRYGLKIPKDAKKLIKGQEFEKVPLSNFVSARN